MKHFVFFKNSFFTFLIFVASSAHTQINGYAKVTAITSNSIFTLSNVNQTFGTFVAGDRIIVIQMQGASITGNTSNNSSFGNLTSLNSAGLYEVATISAVNGAATSMTLTQTLNNSYSTSGGLQIVTYPKLGTTGFTTTADISTVSWNGNVGGVLAFYVSGNLTLNHNISATGTGFRGGAKAGQDGGGCENSTWRIATGDVKYADKGEGVYITTNSQKSGKAKAVNGGGGAIVHNGGGGGGGNYTDGGDGYYGYTGGGYCSATTNAGGQGGIAITSNASRVFMGGGGGGGQENNNVGSNGGIGGGVILIACDTIVATGACSAKSISSNGVAAANGGNDGQGGGGAGGSIVLDIKGMRIKTGCPLTISGNGGNGGSVNDGGSHGAGGGGAQGAIYIRATSPFTNVTLNTNNGAGGNANNGGSPPTGSPGSGSSGSGVNSGQSAIPLPIVLINFSAEQMADQDVLVKWSTASEKDNQSFQLFEANNASDWQFLTEISGQGNSSSIQNYSFMHHNAGVGTHYYRLRQIDHDGSFSETKIISATLKQTTNLPSLFPNPSADFITLKNVEHLVSKPFFLCDLIGNCTPIKPWISNDLRLSFDLRDFAAGPYILKTEGLALKVIIVRD